MSIASFRLGMVGYAKSLGTKQKVTSVVEHALERMETTGHWLTVRRNEGGHDGVLYLRLCHGVVQHYFEPNPNARPTSVTPEWVGLALAHVASFRTLEAP